MTIPLRSLRLTPKSTQELDRSAESSGEIFFDKGSKTLKLFDGTLRGGYALLRADLSNLETTGSSNVEFGTKILVAAGFVGNLTGNVTGRVSDISNHTLDELSDVITNTATAGQLLGFNGTNWTPITLTGTFNGGDITGTLKVNNNTASSSTVTGAFVVSGGVGIAGATHIGSTLTVSGNTAVTGSISATTEVAVTGGPVSIKNNNRLRLYDTDNTNFIGLRSPVNLTSDFTFILPASYGTAGQFLQSNGTGGLSWATPAGGGGGGVSNPPGGDIGSIQFSNGDVFSGTSTFTYDSNNDIVNVTNLVATGDLDAANLDVTGDVVAVNVTASGTVSGTLLGDVSSSNATITGGAISNVTVSASTLSASDSVSFTKNTNSTSTTTGTVVVTGGIGVSQDAYIGGAVSVNTTITSVGNITSNNNITANANIIAGQNVVVSTVPTDISHATNKKYVDTRSLAMAIAMS